MNISTRRQPDNFAQRRRRFEFHDLMRDEADVVEQRGVQHGIIVRGEATGFCVRGEDAPAEQCENQK